MVRFALVFLPPTASNLDAPFFGISYFFFFLAECFLFI